MTVRMPTERTARLFVEAADLRRQAAALEARARQADQLEGAATVWTRYRTHAAPTLEQVELGTRTAEYATAGENVGPAAHRAAFLNSCARNARDIGAGRTRLAAFPYQWERDEQTERRRPYSLEEPHHAQEATR